MKPTSPLRNLLPRTDVRRRQLLTAGLALPVGAAFVACGGGGGGGGSTTPPPGGGGGTLSGRIVAKDSRLWVVDGATGSNTNFAATSSSTQNGVGVSRNGSIADVWGYDGGNSDPWQLTIRSLAGTVTADYTLQNTLLSFPNSAAVLNADATRVAYSVNEMTSGTNSTRIDRTYVNNLANGNLLAVLDNRAEPAFADTGELLVRNGGSLHVYNTALVDQGALSITVEQRAGAYSVSPDGRYIAFEDSSRIRVLDRNTGSTWYATDASPRGHYAPVFSPDGAYIAFLRAGSLALRYLHAIPFSAGTTTTVTDSHAVKSSAGEIYDGTGRIGWSR